MRPCRVGTWSATVGIVDETYVKVAGKWRYVYRAVDQYGQIIDVLVSAATRLSEPHAGSSRRHSARMVSRSKW